MISVTSTKVKQNNVHHENTVQDDNSDATNSETISCNIEDNSAGTHSQSCAESQKECDEVREETEQCVNVKSDEKLDSKEESCDSEVSTERKTASNVVEEKDNTEMNDLSQIITEKLKFLSEGRENVSAVQTMQIQLQVSTYFLIIGIIKCTILSFIIILEHNITF